VLPATVPPDGQPLRAGLRRANPALLFAALFAFLWAIARACVQSVTMDEADTYLKFAGRTDIFHWFPAANNHILNTALIRLFTSIFGLSHLTLRLPALLGAGIYIAGCLYLCVLLSDKIALTFPLFICLVYNPFVADYLVLARGYGMGCAFLVCAIGAIASIPLRETPPEKGLAACSVFAALSFCANFSFAFANLAVLATGFWWISRSIPGSRGFNWRWLAAAALPGAVVTAVIPLPTILQWPSGQLYDFAMSLRQWFGSVIHWSLVEVNPELANPLVSWILHHIEHRLFPALALVVAWRLVVLVPNRREAGRSPITGLAAMLGSALGIATLTHWIVFHAFGLLLPYNRTALFCVPLGTLFVGALAAIPVNSHASKVSARASAIACVTVLSAFAVYFLFCMRLTWSGEMRPDADARDAYVALAAYNHTYCVDTVGASWLYSSVLDFYRVLSGRESFTEFQPGLPMPKNLDVYVLNAKGDHEFIDDQHLSVVYRGVLTDLVIAVHRDSLKRRAPDGGCP
jgi:hypothetical protein